MSAITKIFPTPVYTSEPYPLTEDEIIAAKKHFENVSLNANKNLTTNNKLVLDSTVEFVNLKKFINECINEYFYNILQVKKDINIYMTQSWLNFNKKGTSHHTHFHSNSIISGVFYFTDDNVPIEFETSYLKFGNISLNYENFNDVNYETYNFRAKKGMLVLFPSSLKHNVKENDLENTRISLSLNTFVSGKLGEHNNLTQLTLNKSGEYGYGQ
tara:strand:- start:545 stop:1186 length:642 start_codon:yes stop_codon:yes gene_type:complete